MGEELPQFPGYQVLERVRSGPVADVYRALQAPLGRTVLIKSLSPSILPTSPFAASLEHEARLLAQLEHPNVLRLYDFVRRGDSMWLVLEHVEGVTLRALMSALQAKADSNSVRFEPLEAVAIVYELTRALEHAHAQGVVHSNLRPAHVLLTKAGKLKLLEFASASDARLPTAPDMADGEVAAPAYFSPEQILGEAPDPRSDLFALGVMLFEMLSGQRPFEGPDLRTITQRIRHDSPLQLSRLVPDVPSSLERIVQRLLEKLAADRFGSATELGLVLEALLDAAGKSSDELIRAAIARAGLLGLEGVDLAPTPLASAPVHTLGPPLIGLAIIGVLVLFGGLVIQVASEADGAASADRPGARSLELRPEKPGYLRVVADPWAHVIVDGERVETTPFAEPIPLQAGTHYIRLEHPAAPTERRTITLVPGESILLDVKLNVPRAAQSSLPPASVDAGPASP